MTCFHVPFVFAQSRTKFGPDVILTVSHIVCLPKINTKISPNSNVNGNGAIYGNIWDLKVIHVLKVARHAKLFMQQCTFALMLLLFSSTSFYSDEFLVLFSFGILNNENDSAQIFGCFQYLCRVDSWTNVIQCAANMNVTMRSKG